MADEVDSAASFIVRSRIRTLAREQGKMLSSSFLDLLDSEVRDAVNQACHMIGERKLVKSEEFIKYRNLLARCGSGKK